VLAQAFTLVKSEQRDGAAAVFSARRGCTIDLSWYSSNSPSGFTFVLVCVCSSTCIVFTFITEIE
jgi:hypothetical protein